MSDETENLEFPVIENFSPEVFGELYGLLGTDKIKFSAAVDTGNTGFLQAPLAAGIKASLNLVGVSEWTMADGRKVKMLECVGKIRFAGKELVGVVSLSETSDDYLLGMQFLQKLGMDFTVSLTRKRSIFRKLPPKPVIDEKKSNPEPDAATTPPI